MRKAYIAAKENLAINKGAGNVTYCILTGTPENYEYNSTRTRSSATCFSTLEAATAAANNFAKIYSRHHRNFKPIIEEIYI